MFLDRFSVWWILFGTMGLVFFCLEVGIRRVRARLRSGKWKLEVSGEMVGDHLPDQRTAMAVAGIEQFLRAEPERLNDALCQRSRGVLALRLRGEC